MFRGITSMVLALLLSTGCGQRIDSPTVLEDSDAEYVVTILLDMSGSFNGMMTEEGKAYSFALQVLDRFFRDRLGTRDQLIIAQISGTQRALLWQGTPQQLRQEFPTAAAFGSFLKQNATVDGSLVHEAVATSLKYMSSDPAVHSGRAKAALFVLSDMVDNGKRGPELKARIQGALKAFGATGGIVGLYYVDQNKVAPWRRVLHNAGIEKYCVESDIVSRPALPTFD